MAPVVRSVCDGYAGFKAENQKPPSQVFLYVAGGRWFTARDGDTRLESVRVAGPVESDFECAGLWHLVEVSEVARAAFFAAPHSVVRQNEALERLEARLLALAEEA